MAGIAKAFLAGCGNNVYTTTLNIHSYRRIYAASITLSRVIVSGFGWRWCFCVISWHEVTNIEAVSMALCHNRAFWLVDVHIIWLWCLLLWKRRCIRDGMSMFSFSFSPSRCAAVPSDSDTTGLSTVTPGRSHLVKCLVFLLCSVASKELGLTVVGICLTYDLFLINKVKHD